MNIDGDYLWDKTGAPDPEVKQLEEILGSLRYQPRPLEIPVDLQAVRKRNFFHGVGPGLAIAATIVMVLLGLGVWLGLKRLQRTEQPQLVTSTGNPAVAPSLKDSPNQDQNHGIASTTDADRKRIDQPRPRRVNQSVSAANSRRLNDRAAKNQIPLKKLREAELAKDQMMVAFRLVSAKLNFAQKKAQDLNQREPVHNQHKIG